MQTGVKFFANPSPELRLTLAKWMGCQRFIYNAKVDEERYFRTFKNHSLSLVGQYPPCDQTYSQFKDKEISPWLYEVPSQILRNGSVRYEQAHSRFRQGLSNRPKRKYKSNRQSVWITNELFHFEELTDGGYRLLLISGKIPNAITVSRQSGKWFVSFNYDNGLPEPDEKEIIAHYSSLSKNELEKITDGFDRGVVIALADSNGKTYDLSKAQKKHLLKKEKQISKYQKRMARSKKGSKRQKKLKNHISKNHMQSANIRRDFSHQTSHHLANSEASVFVFENLKIANMVKAPQPKVDSNLGKGGKIKYLKNGRAAKGGLNKSILSRNWG